MCTCMFEQRSVFVLRGTTRTQPLQRRNVALGVDRARSRVWCVFSGADARRPCTLRHRRAVSHLEAGYTHNPQGAAEGE